MRLVLVRDKARPSGWGVWDLYTQAYPVVSITRSDGVLFGRMTDVWRSFVRLVRGHPLKVVTHEHDSTGWEQ